MHEISGGASCVSQFSEVVGYRGTDSEYLEDQAVLTSTVSHLTLAK